MHNNAASKRYLGRPFCSSAHGTPNMAMVTLFGTFLIVNCKAPAFGDVAIRAGLGSICSGGMLAARAGTWATTLDDELAPVRCCVFVDLRLAVDAEDVLPALLMQACFPSFLPPSAFAGVCRGTVA